MVLSGSQGDAQVTHFIAISDLNSGRAFELFEADTSDGVYEKAVMFLGGHDALENGIVWSRSGFGGYFERKALPEDGNPFHEGDENASFWSQVMSDIFEGRDDEEWFIGTDRGAVIAQAKAFHSGEEYAS